MTSISVVQCNGYVSQETSWRGRIIVLNIMWFVLEGYDEWLFITHFGPGFS